MNIRKVVKKTMINALIGLQIGSLYMVFMIYEKAAIKYLFFSIIIGLLIGFAIEILIYNIEKIAKKG